VNIPELDGLQKQITALQAQVAAHEATLKARGLMPDPDLQARFKVALQKRDAARKASPAYQAAIARSKTPQQLSS
jgi:hypothetical protein